MNIKKKLKKNPYAVYIRDRMNFRKGKRFAEQYDDYSAICLLFMQKLGAELSLSNPKRFSEKLQWLKLFYREPLIETCSDKYTARKYIEEIHQELLNELLGVYDSMDDIDFNSLPRQFVLKATHGSGWNLICRDKSKINWKA